VTGLGFVMGSTEILFSMNGIIAMFFLVILLLKSLMVLYISTLIKNDLKVMCYNPSKDK